MNHLDSIRSEAMQAIHNAADVRVLEVLRIKYLGRKGILNQAFEQLKDLSLEEKRTSGPVIQALKRELETLLDQKLQSFAAVAGTQLSLDISMPGKKVAIGHLHPLTILEKQIREIFKAMHFSVVEGPEVETEYYNFDALNIPKNHPARDMWDTFWLNQSEVKSENLKVKNDRLLLRTHTSPVQIRYMQAHQPPFQIIVPGRVFRFEATDSSHETNFHQIEGLMVGKEVSLANFKFVFQEFFKRLFNREIKIRLRPSYFPFVEPGLELDLECVSCGGKGSRICKETGWLEIMGAGMVHPHVFEAAGYNTHAWQCFALGFGLERIAMIKYNIPDIRLFHSGDLRFIKQF